MMVALGALVLAAPAVMAGDLERQWTSRAAQGETRSTTGNDGKSIWQRIVPSFDTSGRAEVKGKLTPTRNYASESEIATGQRRDTTRPQPQPQPQDTARPRQIVLDPAPETDPGKSVARADVAGSRKPNKKTTEAWWWENVGNRPVDAFRDCVAAYSAVQAVRDGTAGYNDIFRKAMETRCHPQFREMVAVLSAGLGQARYEKAMDELVRSTFVPAAVAEIDRARAEARASAGIADAEPLDVGAAKEAMFACFNREADALALDSPAAPRLLAREVVARCDETTRGFFAALFVAYPVDAQAHEASIRIAVEQNYVPAIVTRIAMLRQVRVSSGDEVTGNTPSAPIHTTVMTKQ